MSDIAQSLRALAEKTTKNETPRSGDSSERGMSDIEQALQQAIKALAEGPAETPIIPGTNTPTGGTITAATIELSAPSKQKASQTVLSLTEAKLAKELGVLGLTEAKLAKQLGYELCLCTFPPSVMLWRETEKASVCPSCGRQSKTMQSKRK